MGGRGSRSTSRPGSPVPLLDRLPTSNDHLVPIRILPEPLPHTRHITSPHPIPTAVHGSFGVRCVHITPRDPIKPRARMPWMRGCRRTRERGKQRARAYAYAIADARERECEGELLHTRARDALDSRGRRAVLSSDDVLKTPPEAILLHCYCSW